MAGILLNRSRQVPAEETPAFGGIAERFRRGGDLDRAIALCRDGLKRFPDQLSARVTLGWALLDKGQYDAARGELEYVLRKAPDNLAAIRGLAELHDRTEGALPADDTSWKSDDAPAADVVASTIAEPSVAATAAHDPLAPIPVSFGHGAAEVVHTAAQAELDAVDAMASTFDSALDLAATPVELEDPAAASMAAADPTPFFVVDPGDAMAFDAAPATEAVVPVPFEVNAVDAVNVELETPGAAALAAADDSSLSTTGELDALAVSLETFTSPSPSAFATGFDVAIPDVSQDADTDWAGLTALSGAADDGAAGNEAPAAAFDALAADASGEISGGIDFDVLSTSALDENGEDVAAVFAAPQGLDDIDALAGQELADAIKALEEAAKRVEARLAPVPQRNEPAASPEDIAAFDFGAADLGVAGQGDDQPALLETSDAGAFELVSPDLSDLAFSPDASAHVAQEDDPDTVVADIVGPQFDFDTAPESDDDASEAVLVDALVDDAPAGESDGPAVVAQASAIELLAGLDVGAEFDVTPQDEGVVADALVSDPESDDTQLEAGNDGPSVETAQEVDNVIAWPDASEAWPDADVTVETEAEALETLDAPAAEDARDEGEQAERAEETEADAALAAMVATEFDDADVLRAELLGDEDADVAAIVADVSRVIDTSPSDPPVVESSLVVHVYDVPVFAAAHAAAIAELADLTDQVDAAPAVMMGHAETTRTASPLAALERFLRKVQARQLELRGETVA